MFASNLSVMQVFSLGEKHNVNELTSAFVNMPSYLHNFIQPRGCPSAFDKEPYSLPIQFMQLCKWHADQVLKPGIPLFCW